MPAEVVPGIQQFKVPIPDNPLEFVNAYLIQKDKGWMLVDTGWNAPEAFEALEQELKEVGLEVKDITQIVITHLHPDHYGLAGRLKELSGAELALHYKEKAFIEPRYINIGKLLKEMKEWLCLNGVPEMELPTLQEASLFMKKFVSPCLPDRALYGGERIPTGGFNFEVIWTPGHSLGHICLYEPKKKVLLSGDHVLPNISSNISLHPQSGENPLVDYLNSLKVVEQLEVELVLPAHGDVFTGLKQRIKELFEHHEERMAAILAAISEESRTAYKISSQIPWIGITGVITSWEELSDLERRMALTETLAHLKLLSTEGKVRKDLRDGSFFYSPT